MLSWIMVMTGIMPIGLVLVFKRKQRQAGHIAYWQQQREGEQRKGEAASQLPDSPACRQRMDHAKASVERIDGELSRLTRSQGSVGHRASEARRSPSR